MPHEPLIHWPDPLFELISFVAAFFAAGAVGFRLAVLPRLMESAGAEERGLAAWATRRAARDGLAGSIITAGLLGARDLRELAARRHLGVLELVTSQPQIEVQVALLAIALIGFLFAAYGAGFGWVLAAVGVLIAPLCAAFVGQLQRVVNPLHMLAGGLWIGTLLAMVQHGIGPALRRLPPERRGPAVARLVHGFSPLALGSVALLATMGVITAWTHLRRLNALWTTPYGWTLIVKLGLVTLVLALGAYNWRRQKPRLGTEAGARGLRGSATGELIVAFVVLLVTSVLVSLPSPR